MNMASIWRTGVGLLLCVLAGTICAQQYDRRDPPGRVAHVNHSQGSISYSPSGEEDWLDIERNRPIIAGDRIWTDRAARLELQVGNAAVRLGPETSFEMLQLDDRVVQLQMTEGTMNLRIRRLARGQTFEVATPRLVFAATAAGSYRIDFDPRDDRTTVVIWQGEGEIWGNGARFPIGAGESVRFYDEDLRDYELAGLPRGDEFDRYCRDRDQRLDRSPSLRYVNDDLAGYAGLDDYGSWHSDRDYGNVWYPTRVASNWAPFRDGRWVWQEPWGWTWIDDAPWGFAPSHYGRWVYLSNRWGWIPGPRNQRPIYAPALVVFIGGRNWSLSLSLGHSDPIGWFPLGPREAYVPAYTASRDYFTRINVTNTTINQTTITNVYNRYARSDASVAQTSYTNRTIAGAITAVPADVFVNSRPVRPATLRIDQRARDSAPVARTAAVAPSQRSVLGAGNAARARPSRDALDRPVVVRTAPPPATAPFTAREQLLKRNPGLVPSPPKPDSGRNNRADERAQRLRLLSPQRKDINLRDTGSTRRAPASSAGSSARPSQPSATPKGRTARDPRVPAVEPEEADASKARPPKSRKDKDKDKDRHDDPPRSRTET